MEHVCATRDDGRQLHYGRFGKYELPPIREFFLAVSSNGFCRNQDAFDFKNRPRRYYVDKLLELDLFNPNKKVGLKDATPAQILEKILTDSWTLQPKDKDMIVMYHKFGYELNGKKEQIDSKMVCLGEDQTYTAMAKTVGLPVAMATLLILNGKITTPGVQLPIREEVYLPILKELEEHGVVFKEQIVPYLGYNSD